MDAIAIYKDSTSNFYEELYLYDYDPSSRECSGYTFITLDDEGANALMNKRYNVSLTIDRDYDIIRVITHERS